MRFLKDFLRNLIILAVLFLVIFLIYPDTMKQVFEVYGAILGPAGFLVILVFALPRRRSR